MMNPMIILHDHPDHPACLEEEMLGFELLFHCWL
jgi:hypothetical protein